MSDTTKKLKNRISRSVRSRAKITGTADRPRLSVKISNTNASAQIINDETSTTITSATSVGAKLKGNMSEKAAAVGEMIAKNAKAEKVKKVVFDRGEKKYHGRMKALADAARENGLEF
jgi:large subunit ribosomal protein L18